MRNKPTPVCAIETQVLTLERKHPHLWSYVSPGRKPMICKQFVDDMFDVRGAKKISARISTHRTKESIKMRFRRILIDMDIKVLDTVGGHNKWRSAQSIFYMMTIFLCQHPRIETLDPGDSCILYVSIFTHE